MGAGGSVAHVVRPEDVTDETQRVLAGHLRAELCSLDDVPSEANAVDVLRTFVDNARSLTGLLEWDAKQKSAADGAFLSVRTIDALRVLMKRHPRSEDVQHHAVWVAWFLASKKAEWLHRISKSEITELVLIAMETHPRSESVPYQSAKLLSTLVADCSDAEVRRLCELGIMQALADIMMRHPEAADVQATGAEVSVVCGGTWGRE